MVLEGKIIGLMSDRDYYKQAYESKCEEVGRLLLERRELLMKIEELQNTLLVARLGGNI